MHVRSIALVFPLALGVAGWTSSTQTTGGTSSGASESGSAGSAADSPMSRPGPSVKGHAEDQVIDGRISRISGAEISVKSDEGETQVLEIAPETMIRVKGEEATRADLEEGQPVRASFSEVEGRNVAVEVRADETKPKSEESRLYPGAVPTPRPVDAPIGGREP